jgi:hypothetical protein
MVPYFQVRGIAEIGEEVGGDEGDHLRFAAAVITQIENDGIHVAMEIHRLGCRGTADPGFQERVEFQITDGGWELLDLLEGTIVALHLRSHARLGIRILAAPTLGTSMGTKLTRRCLSWLTSCK